MRKDIESIIRKSLPKIKEWKSKGLSDRQVCHNIGIAKPTLYKYRKEMPELDEAFKEAYQAQLDNIVPELENMAQKLALGQITITKKESGIGSKGEAIDKTTTYNLPPDASMIRFLLANKTRNEKNPYTLSDPVKVKLAQNQDRRDEEDHKDAQSGFTK